MAGESDTGVGAIIPELPHLEVAVGGAPAEQIVHRHAPALQCARQGPATTDVAVAGPLNAEQYPHPWFPTQRPEGATTAKQRPGHQITQIMHPSSRRDAPHQRGPDKQQRCPERETGGQYGRHQKGGRGVARGQAVTIRRGDEDR